MLDPELRKQLQAIYVNLQDKPLEHDDRRYVPLVEDPKLSPSDPIVDMLRAIEFVHESVQLFSGHRGTGKSTQLRRLKYELERNPSFKVVLCDMEHYLPMSDDVDVVDFLLAAAGALSDALAVPELLGDDPSRGTFWTRFVDWLRSQSINGSELGLSAKATVAPGLETAANLKANLKSDPTFRKQVRERMRLHLGAFQADVHAYAQDCLVKLRKRHGDDTQLVIIYDSIEHLRGTTTNAPQVSASVERLFRAHADALRFPFIHTVFTVPPWLRLHHAGTGQGFDNYCHIPCVKVHQRPGPDARLVPNPDALDALWRLANVRGDMQWLLGDRAAFDELALASGGYLRDLLQLLMGIVRDVANYGVPLAPARRALAIDNLRSAYLGFTNREAAWLQSIERAGTLDITDDVDKHTIAYFLDTHVLLGYRNGTDWYGVHPVIREDVARRAAAWQRDKDPA